MDLQSIEGIFTLAAKIEDASVRDYLLGRYREELGKFVQRLERLYVRHHLERKRAPPRALAPDEFHMAHVSRCLRTILPLMVCISNEYMCAALPPDATDAEDPGTRPRSARSA